MVLHPHRNNTWIQEPRSGRKYDTLAITPNDPLGEFDFPIPAAPGFAKLQVPKGGNFHRGQNKNCILRRGSDSALQVSRDQGPKRVIVITEITDPGHEEEECSFTQWR